MPTEENEPNPTRGHSFDELAKGLASGSVSRRQALRLMGGALLGGVLASIPGVAWAQPQGRPDCPPSTHPCPDGTCVAPGVPCGAPPGTGGCGPGQVRVGGQCQCAPGFIETPVPGACAPVCNVPGTQDTCPAGSQCCCFGPGCEPPGCGSICQTAGSQRCCPVGTTCCNPLTGELTRGECCFPGQTCQVVEGRNACV